MQQFRLTSKRRWSIPLLMVACVATLAVTSGTAYASGGTITTPATSPYVATYDATGAHLSYVTIAGTGFAANSLIFVEQCDGVSTSDPLWDPTIDCDSASGPAPVMSDGNGAVTFPAAGIVHSFRPFEGPSPQLQFNCLGSTQADPNNGAPSFTNCSIRVASSTVEGTTDQAFLPLTVPNPTAPAAPTLVKAVSGSSSPVTAMKVSFAAGSIHGSPITTNHATCTATGGVTGTGAGATSPISVTGTTIGKTYTCKVTSTNAIGTSPLSAASPAVIEGSPAAPTGVSAKSGTTTTTTGPLTVTFTPLTAAQANGSVLTTPKYTVVCSDDRRRHQDGHQRLTSPVTVAGATTAKNYTCTVKAHNVRGYGLLSAPSPAVIVGSPAQVAKPTVASTVPGTIKVTFTALTAAQANGSVLTTPKYTATCTSSNGGLLKTATGLVSPINVPLVTSGRKYTCTVKAHNVRGYGLLSLPSLVVTAA